MKICEAFHPVFLRCLFGRDAQLITKTECDQPAAVKTMGYDLCEDHADAFGDILAAKVERGEIQ